MAGGQVEGLVLEGVPVAEEEGRLWGRQGAWWWVGVPAGRVCAGLEEEPGWEVACREEA